MKNKQSEYTNSRFFTYFQMLRDRVDRLRAASVPFLFFQTPCADRIHNLSPFEKERLAHWTFDFNHVDSLDLERIRAVYGGEITVDYLEQVYDGVKITERSGVKYLADYKSRYVNICAGARVTTGQPETFHSTIYIFGQCTARGTGVEDKNTIPSLLQQEINDALPGCYRVKNCAVGCGSDLYDDIKHMDETSFQSGDIVLLCTNLEIVPPEEFQSAGISCYDTSVLFHRPHALGEWFTDMTCHTTPSGNRVIAGYIFSVLRTDGLLKREAPQDIRTVSAVSAPTVSDEMECGINEYLRQLKAEFPVAAGYNGAIVMNCNPFTCGHRYLIQFAAGLVETLYIFVVEEDKSFFPFADRLALVKAGTSDIPNAAVVPSGNFIISAVTFPGYFYKDYNTDVRLDTSADIHIFGKYIAPSLSIKVRFAGEEPFDYVTGQYNQTMRDLLPSYGIAFQEIKRKEYGGGAISASRVRQYIKEKMWDKIKPLVPDTTFQYILKAFKDDDHC